MTIAAKLPQRHHIGAPVALQHWLIFRIICNKS
jgi:hypothetical protein